MDLAARKHGHGDARAASGFTVRAPQLDLPKPGSSSRGLGEKFSVNAVNGTGTFTVPLPLSAARLTPGLSLGYDSGAGNGAFGLGWSIGLPAVVRKTDKRLPQYCDNAESDVFLLSGLDDLVPSTSADGSVQVDVSRVPGIEIRSYRPRIEGAFLRIERWTRTANGDTHWRSLARDNTLSVYGPDAASRIADPADPRRVFGWLLAETRDDKGNGIFYEYKPEDGTRLDLHCAHQANRGPADDRRRAAHLYPKRVRYGNRRPLLDAAGKRPVDVTAAQLAAADWMFEVVFDYGDHDGANPKPVVDSPWKGRVDPFSSFRAGFEVRIERLCRRVLTFHHFPQEAGVGSDCLVRSLELRYTPEDDTDAATAAASSLLASATSCGFRRQGAGYVRATLPSIDFEYSAAQRGNAVRDVDAASLENLPIGLDGTQYHWIDLYADGVQGILTAHEGSWFYKRNLSPLEDDGSAVFGPLERVAEAPQVALGGADVRLADLEGDGSLAISLALEGDGTSGYYERLAGEGFSGFRAFAAQLRRSFGDPNLRLIDLDGDGRADVLITEGDALVWHPSLGRKGFGEARRVAHQLDEETSPRVVFADEQESIFLADMNGDGLSDLVRVRNGSICYWPNRGYGQFGAKVEMDGAPWLDAQGCFDAKRVRLADVEGRGTADLVYLGARSTSLYANRSGNSWSDADVLSCVPRTHDLAAVSVIDLLGHGTSCLVWSSLLPGDRQRTIRYLDLAGPRPRLLKRVVNNLGAETRLAYASSARFCLADRRAGTPWRTALPFAMLVVAQVEILDRIRGSKAITRYGYHDGAFDRNEREFRGFARVDQWDSEDGETLDGTTTLTRTWFELGLPSGPGHALAERGIWSAPQAPPPLAASELPLGLAAGQQAEAARTLKGNLLRLELYWLDGSARESVPLRVTEQRHAVRQLQGPAAGRAGVYLLLPRQTVTWHHERTLVEARVEHGIVIEVGAFGDVLAQVDIAYGRRAASAAAELNADDRLAQATTLVRYSERSLTNPVSDAHDYRTPLAAASRDWAISGLAPAGGDRFEREDWIGADGTLRLATLVDVPPSQTAGNATPSRQLLGAARTLYRADDLVALLPLGTLQPLGLEGEQYQLALTSGLLAQVFSRATGGMPAQPLLAAPAQILTSRDGDGGGYVELDGAWWAPSGRRFFSPTADPLLPAAAVLERALAVAHFYSVRKTVDPFGQASTVDLDAYDLLATRTVDALGNETSVSNDYLGLMPVLVRDANGNRSQALLDALGRVVATAFMGKVGEALGDSIGGVDTDPPLTDLRTFAADPLANAAAWLGQATTRIVYDTHRYSRTQQPAFVATLTRERHVHENVASRINIGFEWVDGFARELQAKQRVEDGDAPLRPSIQPAAAEARMAPLLLNAAGEPQLGPVTPRWVGSGRCAYNRRGQLIRRYEPFFSASHLYESEVEARKTAVGPVLLHDPLDRLVVTLHPQATYDKVVHAPWAKVLYDVNDTVVDAAGAGADPRADPDVGHLLERYFALQAANWAPWHTQRSSGALGPAEQRAAQQSARHAGTPTTLHFDALGREILSVAMNRRETPAGALDTPLRRRVEFDLAGRQRANWDSRDRLAMTFAVDLLGRRLCSHHLDGGSRWLLLDAVGQPIRRWTSRGIDTRLVYDELRRAVRKHVHDASGERLAERTEYGESQGTASNHRGRVHRVFDDAGVSTTGRYDFRGRPTEVVRELRQAYANTADWSQNPALEPGTFTTKMAYDALGRCIEATAPDRSVCRTVFNEAGLLDQVEVDVQAGAPRKIVDRIVYDARGQRTRIAYANAAVTSYEYDPHTFRLTRLRTTRPPGASAASALFVSAGLLQDLRYVYDAAGNIVRIDDAALAAVFNAGAQVEAQREYVYDAVYRLTQASGREHVGQATFVGAGGLATERPFAGFAAHPNNLQALRNYTEDYEYEAASNIQRLHHAAGAGTWTREFAYSAASLLEPGSDGNRLSSSVVSAQPAEPCSYDAHGNLTAMPQSAQLDWDADDLLRHVDLGGGGEAFYVHDVDGRRVRKIIQGLDGKRRSERITLGWFDTYREYAADGDTVTLARDTLHAMDEERRLAMLDVQVRDGNGPVLAAVPVVRYSLADHLGSSSLVLDEAAALVSYEEYHPYGTTSLRAGSSAAEVAAKRFRYAGKERDEETGFSYYGARMYIPWLAHWASVDPRLFEAGAATADEAPPIFTGPELNGYLFVFANPIVHTDPNGREPVPIGYIYTVRSTIDGVEQVYSGQTSRELIQRLLKDKHKWRDVIKQLSTKVEAHAVTAELNVAASSRQSMLSAKKEALSAAEQVIIKRRRSEIAGGTLKAELNAIEAAEEANILTWADRHNVRLGARFTWKSPGVKLGAFAGLQLLDIFFMYRDAQLARFAYAPYLLEDDEGVFSLQKEHRGLFSSKLYFKLYKSGAKEGQRVEISESEFDKLADDAEFLWGKTDWKGDFVPGILRQELPVVEPDPCASGPCA